MTTEPPPTPPPQEPPPEGMPPPQPPAIGSWVSEAWQLVVKNLGMGILMMLLPAIPMIIAGVIMVVAGLPAAITGGAGDVGQAVGAGSMIIGFIVAFAFLVVVMPALYLGILSCFWDMLQTGRLTFDRITAGIPMFGSALGLGVIFGFIFLVAGAVAGVIPIVGTLASFVVSFPLAAWSALAFYRMAVEKVGAIDALTFGWNQLLADLWNLSLMGVVTWAITYAGMLACGVGVLVAGPVTYAAWGACYRDKTGGARPAASEPPAAEPPADEPPAAEPPPAEPPPA